MLFGFLFIWIISTVGLLLVTKIVPGVRAHSIGDLFLAVLILGFINAFIRPLLWVLTLPLTVLSFGLFSLFINAFMIQLTAMIVPGFEVDDFPNAFMAAIIMVLFAIVGFIFVEWFLFGTVFWINFNSSHLGIGM